MTEVVWSDYCGKCGKLKGSEFHDEPHGNGVFPFRHEFVRVPLNFAEWSKALLKELSFFQPSGVMLEVMNVHLARVKAELKKQAEEDEK